MRYEEVSQEVNEILNSVIKEYFTDLINVRFKCIFDIKKRMKSNKFIFASIKKVGEFTQFLAEDEFDYVIVIDKNIWKVIDTNDRIRLIRHEVRHVFIDGEKDDPYRLVDHDIEDFYDEIELNRDDPKWAVRVATIAAAIYDKNKDEE